MGYVIDEDEAASLLKRIERAIEMTDRAIESVNFLREENDALRAQKDGAYSERNQLVALVASMAHSLRYSYGVDIRFDAWLGRHEDKPGEDWDEDWKNIVFIQLPTGQLSWHIHDDELPLFSFLAFRDEPKWDGHTTEEKYERVRKYTTEAE